MLTICWRYPWRRLTSSVLRVPCSDTFHLNTIHLLSNACRTFLQTLLTLSCTFHWRMHFFSATPNKNVIKKVYELIEHPSYIVKEIINSRENSLTENHVVTHSFNTFNHNLTIYTTWNKYSPWYNMLLYSMRWLSHSTVHYILWLCCILFNGKSSSSFEIIHNNLYILFYDVNTGSKDTH